MLHSRRPPWRCNQRTPRRIGCRTSLLRRFWSRSVESHKRCRSPHNETDRCECRLRRCLWGRDRSRIDPSRRTRCMFPSGRPVPSDTRSGRHHSARRSCRCSSRIRSQDSCRNWRIRRCSSRCCRSLPRTRPSRWRSNRSDRIRRSEVDQLPCLRRPCRNTRGQRNRKCRDHSHGRKRRGSTSLPSGNACRRGTPDRHAMTRHSGLAVACSRYCHRSLGCRLPTRCNTGRPYRCLALTSIARTVEPLDRSSGDRVFSMHTRYRSCTRLVERIGPRQRLDRR